MAGCACFVDGNSAYKGVSNDDGCLSEEDGGGGKGAGCVARGKEIEEENIREVLFSEDGGDKEEEEGEVKKWGVHSSGRHGGTGMKEVRASVRRRSGWLEGLTAGDRETKKNSR